MSKLRWFTRRRVGFGVRPTSWQGWVVTATAIGLVVVSIASGHNSTREKLSLLAIVLAYLGIAYATGGLVREVDPSTQHHDEPSESPTAPAARSLSITDIHERLKPLQSAEEASELSGPVAIEVRHLTKRFADRTAFEDVSFDVRQGEVFGFLGPNGAGKTTTVRTLATLIEATSGSASVAGLEVNSANGVEIRRRISVMPEVPGLYSRLSVQENLEFFVGLYALDGAKERIGRALEAVNLTTRSRDVCASLSKGLRQRVSIARALLSDPEIIFLDEPTSGLDPVATREVSELIEGLRQRGVTIFLTTHRLEEAERLCDRVAILNTTLRIVGRTAELRKQLFQPSLIIVTAAPLAKPEELFAAVPGVGPWSVRDSATYEVNTRDPRTSAPLLVRALVDSGADVISIGESKHSLQDVYLQLVDEDVEARK